jgi:hypothetical protein
VLIAVGAFGVHDLRYLIAYGGRAGQELSLQGHGYLRVVAPLVAGLVVLAAAAFAVRLARAYASGRGDGAMLPSTPRIWGLASSLLVAIFACQEWVEGLLAEGHPGGIGAPFSHGGWIALPLAIAIGLLVALALRGAARAIAVAAQRGARARIAPAAAPLVSRVARSVWAARLTGALSRRLSPRAPPAVA